jgi:hypothetical protein
MYEVQFDFGICSLYGTEIEEVAGTREPKHYLTASNARP